MKKKSAALPIKLRPAEYQWGIRYLLFELVFLGPILSVVLSWTLPDAQSIHVNTLYFAINFIAVILIFRNYLLASVSFTASHWIKTVVVAAGCLFAYFTLTKLVNLLTVLLMPGFENVNDRGVTAIRDQHPLMTAIGTILLVPLAEETLHRGLIFGMFHGKNRLLAYLISTFAFCSIHVLGYVGMYPTVQLLLCFMQYIPAGLVLAFAYETSGSIFCPVLMHTTINLLAFLTMR